MRRRLLTLTVLALSMLMLLPLSPLYATASSGESGPANEPVPELSGMPITTFVVNNLNDSGPGSLRQAVIDANANPGADAIAFNVTGTITLTSGTLVISDAVNILGPSPASLTVNGSNAIRVFEISAGATAMLSGMTITASNGIGVLNRGTTTINSCNLLGSSQTGITNEGTMTVTNSLISNNQSTGQGGGIFSLNGTLTVINSTVSDNTAPLGGGGIASFAGSLTVIDSTVSNNFGFEGAGIDSENNGTVSVINCTLSGNNGTGGGGGGITIGSGTGNIANCTITNNSAFAGAGIRNFGTVNVKNSIVTDNHLLVNPPGFGGDCGNLGTLNAFGTNFTTDGSCFGFTQISLAQINLGPLQTNAPGTTATHALLPGSIAIDAVTDCTDLSGIPVIHDQRGVSRPLDGNGDFVPRCDAGAYEAPALVLFDQCIQDDSTGSILKINSTTGDYQFTNCSGFTLSGRGIVTVKGGIISLQHSASDRRVTARLDSNLKRGTASIQVFQQATTLTISDRNTSNNTCACATQ
jgi:parallel beta helix pectate lyase-like protein